MCVSPFQKRHKKKKPTTTTMSQVTPPSSWALLYMLVQNGQVRFIHFFSRLLLAAEMPPDAGHGKRESAPATISGYHVFPVLKPSCHAFCQTGHGRQDRLKTCAVGRKLATASHARMTMTVAGLLSRRQESGAFPLSVAPPFELPRGALRHPLCFPLFLPASPASMPIFPCRHSRRHQWPFSLQGQR